MFGHAYIITSNVSPREAGHVWRGRGCCIIPMMIIIFETHPKFTDWPCAYSIFKRSKVILGNTKFSENQVHEDLVISLTIISFIFNK